MFLNSIAIFQVCLLVVSLESSNLLGRASNLMSYYHLRVLRRSSSSIESTQKSVWSSSCLEIRSHIFLFECLKLRKSTLPPNLIQGNWPTACCFSVLHENIWQQIESNLCIYRMS